MPEPKNDGIMSLNVKKLLQICIKYFEKKKKLSKARQNRKTLISVYVYFLSASSKNLYLLGKLGTDLCIHVSLRFS